YGSGRRARRTDAGDDLTHQLRLRYQDRVLDLVTVVIAPVRAPVPLAHRVPVLVLERQLLRRTRNVMVDAKLGDRDLARRRADLRIGVERHIGQARRDVAKPAAAVRRAGDAHGPEILRNQRVAGLDREQVRALWLDREHRIDNALHAPVARPAAPGTPGIGFDGQPLWPALVAGRAVALPVNDHARM